MQTATKPLPNLPADYRLALQGRLPPPLVDANATKLAATTRSYGANGSIVSELIHLSVQVTITGGKTFNGSAWGISYPGGGALFGDVYTSDLAGLYANTVGFNVIATPVYTTVIFMDAGGNSLGSLQAGAVSTVSTPLVAGSGTWS